MVVKGYEAGLLNLYAHHVTAPTMRFTTNRCSGSLGKYPAVFGKIIKNLIQFQHLSNY